MNGIQKKYRLAIIEPSAIVTEGLKTLLAPYREFEIAGCFTELHPFLERIPMLHPEILLINPSLIDYQKRTNLRSFLPEQTSILTFALLYHYTESEVLKQYNGVIEITDEASLITRKLRQAIESNQDNSEVNDSYELSEREIEILTAVARGLTNKEIADLHNISIHTVISHRKNITRKTGIKTVSGLTVYAFLNNLIDQSEVE